MKPIKVLQFITPAGFYGAERWVLALANNINTDRLVCDLAVTRESVNQDLSVAEYYPESAGNVHYLTMNGAFDFKVVRNLAKLLVEEQIDIIHTHGYKSDIIGWFAARRAGIKCVSTPHGYPTKAGLKMSTYIHLGAMALRRFDRVTPLSRQLEDDMNRFRVPSGITRFIENGVDLTELEPYQKASRETPDASLEFHIGYIGQIIPRKGIKDLLDTFEGVFKQYPEAKLTIVGDGIQRSELEAYAQTLRSSKQIQFLGFRDDRLALLSDFDAFVMTSSLEGIPRCLMEAMSLDVPVVAYDIPGVDQLIAHEKTGLLAPLGDVQALTQSLTRLIEEPSLRSTLVRNGKALVENRFSAKRMADEYEAVFNELVDQRSTTEGQVL